MRQRLLGGLVFLAASGFALLAHPAKAAITSSVLQSDVQAYFGSRGTGGYEASNPVVGPWTAPGAGPYAIYTPLPGVPAPPVAPVWPSSVSGNPFSPSYVGSFTDGLTPATSATFAILAHNNPAPTLVSQDHINLPSMSLVQNAGAPGYAYEQLDFEADYGVIGGILSGSTPSYPLHVYGTVSSGLGTYAQFDAVMNYYWIPSNNTAFYPSGSPVYLGSLDYSALHTGGSYNGYIYPTGTLSPATTNWGVLEITGDMWVAGDPSSITVSGSPVPEPSSLGLLGVGLLMLGRRSRQRRVPANKSI